MKISALRLFNVKRFAGRGVAIEGIGEGVNVLCAPNEFGKSTSFEALHALFFQPHSSTARDVHNLRPYSGGNPILEADLATADGRFRITKQYYGGRSARVTDLATGRLLAQADEAENFIAGLIKGGTAGPAGLLWVRQGITGIERRSKTEKDDEKEVRRSLIESVQGEVEAVTGGRRMAEVMAATQAALAELVADKGKPKAGGRYKAARDERDRLVAEERKLSDQVAALREALDRRAGAARRFAELDRAEERSERRRGVETAQAAFDAARQQSEKLKTAEAELRLASERRDTADRDLGAFRSALERSKELRARLHDASQHRADAHERRREVGTAIESANAKAETAEAEAQEARALLARLDRAMKAREAWERRAELKQRLDQAEALRQTIEAADAKLPTLRMAAKGVEQLSAVDVEIATLRASEDAARPSVVITYEADSAGRVAMDGAVLAHDEERRYDGQAALSVPGVGTITLRSNRVTPRDNRIERAVEGRRKLLASLGVEDLAEARAKHARAQALEAERREFDLRLALLAPDGLPKLREQFAAVAAIEDETLELKADPEQVRAVLATAEQRSVSARQNLRESEAVRAHADETFIAAEKALAAIDVEWKQNEAALGAEDTRVERERTLANAVAARAEAFAAAHARAEALRTGGAAMEFAEAALKRARSSAEAAEKEIAGLRETIAQMNGVIATQSDEAVEENWRETADALAAANERVAAFETEVAVLRRLSSALANARTEAREIYLKPVMSELKPLLGLLFDDASITFDDENLLPQSLMRNGQQEDVARLSGGMREQLSVLTRLAFARLIARDGRPTPVILDDALVYSDDDRIEKMFDALHRQSTDQQIIVFSCRQRAFQKLGGNILTMTPWQP